MNSDKEQINTQDTNNESKLSWLKLGIKILDSKGWKGLKINDMCHQLNLTKGAFYHWFQSKKDFEMQVLKFWKQKFTSSFIDVAESGKTSKEKLSILGRQCIDGTLEGTRLEYEINAWSLQDDDVKTFVTSVYETRYNYLVKLLSDIHDDPVEVKKQSLILYSLVIGVDLFYKPLSRDELELIFSDFI
jgi:AcrR family transcriptional regulator